MTLGKYQQLCTTIVDSGYEIRTVRDYLANVPSYDSSLVILRQDVARKLEKAVAMAVLEKTLVYRQHIISDAPER